MKGAIGWALVVLGVIIVGGFLLFRTSAPAGDVVPEGTAVMQDDSTPGTQFLQQRPDSLPPVVADEISDVANDKTDSNSVSQVETIGASPEAADEESAISELATGEEVIISMTDLGFEPEELSVDVGTTVRFVNNGQAMHWPASDVHPTHQVLPDFDSKQGVPTGSGYSFTFTEQGAWSFHDHLNPNFTGTVTVE